MTARHVRSCCASLLVACGVAFGQTSATQPYPPIPVSPAERKFALSLFSLTPEQARETIAHADQSVLTAGSATALREEAGVVRQSQPKVALVMYEEALQIARPLRNGVLLGNLLYGKADAFRFSGDAEGSLPIYAEAMAAYSEGHPGSARLAFPLIGRALAKRDLGDIEGAIEDDLRSLALSKEGGDEVGMARALNNLGLVEQISGDYQAAREHYAQGLVLARAQKQRMGEAFLLNNIANTYIQQDNAALATQFCLQSLKIKEEAGTKDDLVSSLVNLGRIYQQAGKPADAMRALERASGLAHESKRPTLVALAMAALGELDTELKHYRAAREHLDEAIAAARTMHERMREFETLGLIADLELATQQYAEAARDADRLLAFASATGVQGLVARSAATSGRAHLKLGHRAQARSAFETSVAAYEVLRENTAGGDQVRSEFFAKHSLPYQMLAALDVEEGRFEDALALSEREKGRALLDLLTRGRSNLSKELTGAEKKEQVHLRARIAALEAQRLAAALDDVPDPPQFATLDEQLKGARGGMEGFRERMSAAHPEMDRHRGSAKLIALSQTAELLRGGSTAILEYEVTPSATYLFVITQGAKGPALRLYTIPISGPALGVRVNRFAGAIAGRAPGFAAEAGELYRLLLSPAKAQLRGKTSLMIVPGGELWHLPFQALRDAEGKYLLESAAVSYAPSLSVLRAYAGKKQRAGTRQTLVAFGDPGNNLPEAAREVKTVSALYSRPASRVFVGGAATKDNFETYAGRYDIVHVATHGLYDDRDPMYSHLLLAGAADGPSRAPMQLDAAEIAGMEMSASLVVLSACQTADGRFREGEGLIGLSWSFLAAGSQSAIASQWRVESSSTTELMIAFHQNLKLRLSKAEALRRAELRVARDVRYEHPFYWAGFALLGEN